VVTRPEILGQVIQPTMPAGAIIPLANPKASPISVPAIDLSGVVDANESAMDSVDKFDREIEKLKNNRNQ